MLHECPEWAHSLYHLSSVKTLSLMGPSANKPGPLKIPLYTLIFLVRDSLIQSLRATACSKFSLRMLSSSLFLSIYYPSQLLISLDKVLGWEGHSSSVNRQSWFTCNSMGWTSLEVDGVTEILNNSQFSYFPIHTYLQLRGLKMNLRLPCRD